MAAGPKLTPYNGLLKIVKERIGINHYKVFHQACVLFAEASIIEYDYRQFTDACDVVKCWLQQQLPDHMVRDSEDGGVSLATDAELKVRKPQCYNESEFVTHLTLTRK